MRSLAWCFAVSYFSHSQAIEHATGLMTRHQDRTAHPVGHVCEPRDLSQTNFEPVASSNLSKTSALPHHLHHGLDFLDGVGLLLALPNCPANLNGSTSNSDTWTVANTQSWLQKHWWTLCHSSQPCNDLLCLHASAKKGGIVKIFVWDCFVVGGLVFVPETNNLILSTYEASISHFEEAVFGISLNQAVIRCQLAKFINCWGILVREGTWRQDLHLVAEWPAVPWNSLWNSCVKFACLRNSVKFNFT